MAVAVGGGGGAGGACGGGGAEAGPSPGKLSRKQAQKEAELVLCGMGALGDIAFQKELEFLGQEFQKNKALAYTISSLLKDGTLEKVLAGNAAGGAAAAAAPGPRVLARSCRRVKHLRLDLVREILRQLLPEGQTEWLEVPENRERLVPLLCFALNCTPDFPLPHTGPFPQCAEVARLKDSAARGVWGPLGDP